MLSNSSWTKVPRGGSGGGVSGSSIHFHRCLWVKRFQRRSATRLESDQSTRLRNCNSLSSSMAMSAVQIWMLSAFLLVPTKVLILRFCLMALKKSSICHRCL